MNFLSKNYCLFLYQDFGIFNSEMWRNSGKGSLWQLDCNDIDDSIIKSDHYKRKFSNGTSKCNAHNL